VALPSNVFSVKLNNVAESVARSPIRTKRGRLSWAIPSLAATTSSVNKPAIMSFVWAKAMNFHVVRLSGKVKRKVTTPLVSAIKRG